MHIEQATKLEKQRLDIGIVTAIPGIHRYRITVSGVSGHSGTTLMAGRKDALVAAADVIRNVNELALEISRSDNQHFVATIGKIDVFLNGAATVPGEVTMTLDLRAVSEISRKLFFKNSRA